MLLFIIGPSSSGKGTQADLLAKEFGIPHISMGQLLRDEIESKTEIGKVVEPMLKNGVFVPGSIVIKVLEGAVEKCFNEFGGAIIDGFPRMKHQVKDANGMINKYKDDCYVIHYVLSYEDCVARLNNRLNDGGARADDAALKMRYSEYEKDIEYIKEYYNNRSMLIEIDARPSREKIFVNTLEEIKKKKEEKH